MSPVWFIYDSDDIVLQALQDPQSHSVTYTLSRHQAVVVEYKQDEDTDMFQVWENSPGSKKLSYKCPFFISATAAVTHVSGVGDSPRQ